ncbi:MAG: MerR family transcriptional regulator [Micropruina sp.]|nr:MerR family transcriptional regulator [Micropruina sp.]
MYTIGQAAKLTGIPAETLRAWERRYGLTPPERTNAGYRLYDDAALATFREVGRLVEAGWKPREAVLALKDHDVEWLPDAREFVEGIASGSLDLEQATATLGVRFAVQPFSRVVDEWLLPMLGFLGEEWAKGRISVEQEHELAAALMRRLGLVFESAAVQRGGPVILMGLTEGNRHELGLMAFACIVRSAGLDVRYLGPDLPAEEWGRAAKRARPAAVVTTAPSQADLPQVLAVLDAVRAIVPDVVMCVGGQRQYEVGEPVIALGHRFGEAAHSLAQRLGVAV